MQFSGTLTDGKTSAREAVEVFYRDGVGLEIRGATTDLAVPLKDCRFHPPLGKIRRLIDLPEGRALESDDLETVDAIGALTSEGKGLRFVHALESRWRTVFASLAVVVVFIWSFYQFGIPAIATDIAFRLPASVLDVASEQTAQIIEKLMFDPTELAQERQTEVEKGFHDVIAALGTEPYTYELHFRSADGMPNAFALPSGDIYITDALIEGAEDDREIFAVLAHEVTHVEKRHGMRMVLQNTGVFFLISVMLGDVVSASTMGAALPSVLAESGYSRGFENEADEGAAHYCIKCGWGTEPMRNFLNRIAPPGPVPQTSWMSSHPDTGDRVRRLLEIEKALRKRAIAPKGNGSEESAPAGN